MNTLASICEGAGHVAINIVDQDAAECWILDVKLSLVAVVGFGSSLLCKIWHTIEGQCFRVNV